MTAKITVKCPVGAFNTERQTTSIYTDRWVENLSDLLVSFSKWSGSEIKSVEVMEN